jgi:RNA polymerase sigma-70 factor (ECF subfamily)
MEWNQAKVIEACKKKDKKAQKALFHRYKKQLLGLCLRYVNSRELAEEVLMDAFIVVFKKIHTCNTQTFEPWLKSIVVHKAIDFYRKHKNDPVFDEIEYVLDKKAESQAAHNLEAAELIQMLQFLPVGYRMVFNMYAIEGFQHKEIAEKLGISENTSKSQLRKAKAKLQDILEKGGYHG